MSMRQVGSSPSHEGLNLSHEK